MPQGNVRRPWWLLLYDTHTCILSSSSSSSIISKNTCRGFTNLNTHSLRSLIGRIDATTTRGNSSNCKVRNLSFIRQRLKQAYCGRLFKKTVRSVTSQTLILQSLLSCKVYRLVTLLLREALKDNWRVTVRV